MNIKSSLIALAVRIIADNSNIVRKPDQFESFLNTMFGVENDEQRLTREIEESIDQMTATVKRVKIDREFKKITQNA